MLVDPPSTPDLWSPLYSEIRKYSLHYKIKSTDNQDTLTGPRVARFLPGSVHEQSPILSHHRDSATRKHLKNVYSALAVTMLAAGIGAVGFFFVGVAVSAGLPSFLRQLPPVHVQ